MDNATRSERSRNTAIKAAFALISREGPSGLTFDALALESGISKGGLLHQFRTKTGILEALLEYQKRYYSEFESAYLKSSDAPEKERGLAAQIAIMKATIDQPHSVGRAVMAALVQEPRLLESICESYAVDLKKLREDAPDGDVAVFRWAAAVGLAFTDLLSMSPLSSEERERLFERLLDTECWWNGVSPKPSSE
jgi:AcrR family transcriptional regulator